MTDVMDAATIAAQGGPIPGGGPTATPLSATQPVQAPAAAVPYVAPMQVAQTPVDSPQVDAPAVTGGPSATELAAEVARLRKAEADRKAADAKQTVYDLVAGKPGGTDADFAAFSSWAAAGGLSPEEVTVLNETLRSGTATTQQVLLKSFVDRRTTAMQSQTPGLIAGSTPGIPATTPTNAYISKGDYLQVMRSDKWKTDPDFREHARARRKASIGEEKKLR